MKYIEEPGQTDVQYTPMSCVHLVLSITELNLGEIESYLSHNVHHLLHSIYNNTHTIYITLMLEIRRSTI